MKKPLILLSLIASLGAGAGFAQSADGDDPATPPSGGLDLGEPVAAQPRRADVPETYVKEVFKDWSLQCVKVSEERELCQMYQLLQDEEGTKLADVYIFKVENAGQAVAAGVFTVPLETLLPAKMTVQVDTREAKRYDYSFCNQQGCFARVGFTAEDIDRFKAGSAATVSIVPMLAPDKPVALSMSLSGFTAAFDETSAR
ncbi:invasion associated locus B family protein [Mameliella sediminis]|uniref:invasion associated locus B family protein n=1 Tax=Mameliella sediminis TaxID=2836866 RepID=UPI001C46DDEF|nr:invasion associated locus B family protein [Mameliella sediminis]MBY6115683.1 invasion associated locus B family protein [Antarctobacter heliothermus]MBY6145930.1 invasion associated locus B family protein [Mameliella alba]MBV7393349.1 invasion associated locus B family protein [Mameliella sediminis]MBY6161252.1 invasion associated locus B family protein [Mameliella alba]MBY6169722.1 invasion associated locus B family protein [Mameliella alba]